MFLRQEESETNNAPQQERDAQSIQNSSGRRQRVIHLILHFATRHKPSISTILAVGCEQLICAGVGEGEVADQFQILPSISTA